MAEVGDNHEAGSYGEYVSAFELVTNAFAERAQANTRAVELETQAAALRDVSNEEFKLRWTDAKESLIEAAGDIPPRDLLVAIMDFRDITEPGKFKYDHYDKQTVLSQFDSIVVGEPLLTAAAAGIVSGTPRVWILDHISALGAYLHIPLGVADLKLSVGRETDTLIVGAEAIQTHLNNVNYSWISNRVRGNLDSLKALDKMIGSFEGKVEFDTTHLERQIQLGENYNRRMNSARSKDPLRRALEPRR